MRKLLLAGFTVIVIGVICLAFTDILGRFPDEWEWVAIVIAGVGIVLVIPSTFQMFWGRAYVKTEFKVSAKGDERSLVILLQNPPVQNRVLKTLGVRRETVQSLTGELRISEAGSNVIIDTIRRARIFTDEDKSDSDRGSNRIVLPPTYSVAASMMIAMWDNNLKGAIVLGDLLRKELLLRKGYYTVQIMIFVDGEPVEESRQFVVGEKADDLIWTKPRK